MFCPGGRPVEGSVSIPVTSVEIPELFQALPASSLPCLDKLSVLAVFEVTPELFQLWNASPLGRNLALSPNSGLRELSENFKDVVCGGRI